jgi:outer membrane protein assembly factor BamB
MHHNHINRDGFFTDPKLTAAAAATMHNDATFNATFTGAAFATPLFVDAGQVPALNGGKGAFFVATATNDVYAFDEATGAVVWHVTPGAPAAGPGVGCGNVRPQGVIGTPAIDLATQLIVMDGGSGAGGLSDHVVYGLDLATGTTKWHVGLNGVKDPMGRAFEASQHFQRPATLIVNGFAYFAFSGNIGDCGAYHGTVIGVSLDGVASKTRMWRTDDAKCGIWGPGGPSSDGNAIYVSTGNGSGPATWMGSEGVIRLGFDLSFTRNGMDYYTPATFAGMDGTDADISSSNPIVIDALGMHLLLAMGKDGLAYLVDRTNMGGVGGQLVGRTRVAGGQIATAAAWATIGGATYVVAEAGGGCAKGGGDLFAVKLDMAAANKMTEVWCANAGGATSPIITSSDGTSDAIVWIGSEYAGKLSAFDLATGKPIANTTTLPGMQHISPSILAANGRIFAAGNDGTLHAFTP